MDLLRRYGEGVLAGAPLALCFALLIVAALWVCSRISAPQRSWVRSGLVVGGLLVGGLLAVRDASLVDDAFISFRYARNLLSGHGLVFNPGERVEGYTNFLWTLLLAAEHALTGIEIPTLALVSCCCVFVLAVLAVARLSWKVNGHAPNYLPLAALLFAVQGTVCAFATTGLETLFACLLVTLAATRLMHVESWQQSTTAGSLLILATLTRPDHSLFYVAGGIALGLGPLAAAMRTRSYEPLKRALPRFKGFVLPLFPYAAVLGWKLWYYGSILPNTFHAKSANEDYFSQGIHYAYSFYLGSHFWILIPAVLYWLVRGKGHGELRVFVATALVLYNAYVLKVGGDFMAGRFYVVLVPLFLIGAEAWLYSVARVRWMFVGATVLSLTAHGVHVIPQDRTRYHGITNESSVYRVEWAYPVKVRHPGYDLGNLFGRALEKRGVRPLIATSGIGMVSYYSNLPVLDLVGLTDATVARTPLKKRGRPGHEKWATERYLLERKPLFIRHPKLAKKYAKYRGLTRLDFGDGMPRNWSLFIYDRESLATIREVAPEIRFVDFEVYLDEYLRNLDDKSQHQVERDLRFFRRYYFDHNDDERRLAPLERRAQTASHVPRNGL
jgi:hypothetical protein